MADISSVKSEKLFGTAELEPRDRVPVKSVEGSMIETHGSLETQVLEGEMRIPYRLQLVSKQADLKCDGILGRDFLKVMRARICYREQVLIFQYEGILVRKKLTFLPGAEPGAPRDERVNKLTLPTRTEMIVQVPVDAGPRVQEGVVGRAELLSGVYMAERLVKVENGCIITSIINTTAEEVELPDQVVKLEEINDKNTSEAVFLDVMEQGKERGDQNLSRRERVIGKLKDDHLNAEEKKLLREICLEYQDVFYLAGDKFGCTNAAKHTIQLESGVSPINTRPYGLPESHKEIDRQVKQFVEDGIVTPIVSPWNSPLLCLIPSPSRAVSGSCGKS